MLCQVKKEVNVSALGNTVDKIFNVSVNACSHFHSDPQPTPHLSVQRTMNMLTRDYYWNLCLTHPTIAYQAAFCFWIHISEMLFPQLSDTVVTQWLMIVWLTGLYTAYSWYSLLPPVVSFPPFFRLFLILCIRRPWLTIWMLSQAASTEANKLCWGDFQ